VQRSACCLLRQQPQHQRQQQPPRHPCRQHTRQQGQQVSAAAIGGRQTRNSGMSQGTAAGRRQVALLCRRNASHHPAAVMHEIRPCGQPQQPRPAAAAAADHHLYACAHLASRACMHGPGPPRLSTLPLSRRSLNAHAPASDTTLSSFFVAARLIRKQWPLCAALVPQLPFAAAAACPTAAVPHTAQGSAS
jgi:hypothetical protein